MKRFDFNKYSSALKQRLRDALRKHESAYAFKMSKVYSQTVKDTLNALRIQEEEFADFVIRKQKEIDAMELGIIKSRMQKHLDKISVYTYEHFCKLTDKYEWMLKGDNDEELKFNYSKN
jgi:hypothetical protein